MFKFFKERKELKELESKIEQLEKEKKEKEIKDEYKDLLSEIAKAKETHNSIINVIEPETLISNALTNSNNNIKESIKTTFNNRVKLSNQWTNYALGVNDSFSNMSHSSYHYEVVRYRECIYMSQDSLMHKVIQKIAEAPFRKGGRPNEANWNQTKAKKWEELYNIYQIKEKMIKARMTANIYGGCLIYKNCGGQEAGIDLTLPFSGRAGDLLSFEIIDPMNCGVLEVNTLTPALPNYMNPEYYYVLGLGKVHFTHFIKYCVNEPPDILKPSCLYFGFPTVQLIKGEVANCKAFNQNIVEFSHRIRTIYMNVQMSKYLGTGNKARLLNRLKLMQATQNNYSIGLLDADEKISQYTSSLNGMNDVGEYNHKVLSITSDLPLSMLLNTQDTKIVNGVNTDMISIDFIKNEQEKFKNILLQIVPLIYESGISDYIFDNPYENDDLDKAIITDKTMEIIYKMCKVGIKKESIIKWLQTQTDFKTLEFSEDFEKIRDLIIKSELTMQQGQQDTGGSGGKITQSKSANDNRKEESANEKARITKKH